MIVHHILTNMSDPLVELCKDGTISDWSYVIICHECGQDITSFRSITCSFGVCISWLLVRMVHLLASILSRWHIFRQDHTFLWCLCFVTASQDGTSVGKQPVKMVHLWAYLLTCYIGSCFQLRFHVILIYHICFRDSKQSHLRPFNDHTMSERQFATFPYLVVTKLSIRPPHLNFTTSISHMLPCQRSQLNALLIICTMVFPYR